jgi:hypothetical protein
MEIQLSTESIKKRKKPEEQNSKEIEMKDD